MWRAVVCPSSSSLYCQPALCFLIRVDLELFLLVELSLTREDPPPLSLLDSTVLRCMYVERSIGALLGWDSQRGRNE